MLHHTQAIMRMGCMLSIGLLLIATVFLFIFANPVGWILGALFAVAAFIIALIKGVDWQRLGFRPPVSHKHGPEDLQRGPNEDPMMK